MSSCPRGRRIAFLLTAIAIIFVALGSAQAQKSARNKFTATPLSPTNTIVLSAADKEAILKKGIDERMAINAPQLVAACSPEVTIAPGTSPAGYLPLSAFGVPAIAGVTDDSVTNFTTPAFSYAGQTWTSIGISSNGYAIVGGGNNTDDNTFVNQLFPNPTRPNNVLAPFWTDLNPASGGALRIATLTDGTNTWIVLDWEAVRYFSTTDTVNFQIWIGILGDPSPVEDITYPYGPISGAGNNNGLTVGAENQFGDRGANRYFSFFGGGSTGTLPANGTELRVSTSTPASCMNQASETAVGLTTSNRLVTFNTNAPSVILRDVAITGLLGGEIVLGIDFRPANGQLSGFTSYNRIVTLDPLTGAATLVGVPNSLGGNEYGFDFNPTVDRIRIVNDTNQNARINPDTGATAGTDTNLAYAPGDPFFGNDPTVTGAAYTNNFSGATSTTLYDIDSGLDVLVTQGSPNGSPTSPNSGQLFTVGSLGVSTNNLVGFDISGNTGIAYATLSDAFNVTSLYTINLTNGNATLVGQVGSSTTSLRGLAISPVLPPTIFGVTTANQLVSFNAGRPGLILSSVPITGLINGEAIIGIDFRPATGQLYGFTGYNRIVTINTTTGAATVVGSPNSLLGNEYGFDFNPTVDRIRIVNDTDQNARVNPDTGATAATDPNLAYAAGDPNFGQDPTVTGVAYSNNFAGATTTTLYDIDSGLDILTTQNPPNNGTLNTVGPLGVNTSNLVGFDISGQSGIAYATLSDVTNASSLYTINLTTGAATLVGQIGSSATSIRAMSVSTIQAPTIIGLTTGNRLVRFNSNSPGSVSSATPITGLLGGEAVLAIDYRPANGLLYGYTNFNRVVSIDSTTGAATFVGSPASLTGSSYGFDFNPTADRIRVINDADQNVRVNPNNGTLAGTDTNLTYAAGDPNFGQNPNAVGAAYTNNFSGATSTTLYDIDSNLDTLVTQGSPNGSPTSPNTGQLFTVGSLGFNTSDVVGFDIAAANNAAYAALQPASGGFSSLYSINLSTGQATLIGQIGGTEAILGIAIAPAGTVAVNNVTPTSVAENAGSVTVTVTRSGDTSSSASVSYTTQDGTATAGSDYTTTSGTLFFNPGETTKTFNVPIIDNAVAESSETFSILLSNASNGFTFGTSNPYTITITDND
ncbi:MAG: trimeric autotransporter adhesin [Blastocatellia bacterium]|jgi:heat shock protein HslJ|nr:trimeric autotransporter adhesin [Blastocatellia bacterium]